RPRQLAAVVALSRCDAELALHAAVAAVAVARPAAVAAAIAPEAGDPCRRAVRGADSGGAAHRHAGLPSLPFSHQRGCHEPAVRGGGPRDLRVSSRHVSRGGPDLSRERGCGRSVRRSCLAVCTQGAAAALDTRSGCSIRYRSDTRVSWRAYV